PAILYTHPVSIHSLTFYFSTVFFFNDTPPPDTSTLSLHDALPIYLMDRITSTGVDPARAAGSTARELDRLLGATRGRRARAPAGWPSSVSRRPPCFRRPPQTGRVLAVSVCSPPTTPRPPPGTWRSSHRWPGAAAGTICRSS